MSEYQFKTIYFPKNRVRTEKATRVNISFPLLSKKNGWPKEFVECAILLSSAEIRNILGDPMLDCLEDQAAKEYRSLSNVILSLLFEEYKKGNIKPLTESDYKEKGSIGVTFSDSLRKSSYGWYPYVEGFSANYARDALLRWNKKPEAIFDPFGGSGTTQLSAALLGVKSYYSELNPFMVEVCEAKVTSAAWARKNLETFTEAVDKYLILIQEGNLKEKASEVDLSDYYHAFPNRDFFEEDHLRELLAALECVEVFNNLNKHIVKLFRLACAANAVACSNMTRRADLRRRRSNEYKNRVVNVSAMISDTVNRMLRDIRNYPEEIEATEKVSNDARDIPEKYNDTFDFVLTSPPYLNGTNYFRNTKIELWLLSLIDSEKDLKSFRELTVTGGINDVSIKKDYFKFEGVEIVASKLDLESKDKRIPKMVRHYFSDMYEVLASVFRAMKPGGRLLLDIGDSKFYGVHVPTDKLLCEVAEKVGFIFVHESILAKRLSRDKTELVQVELVFKKRVVNE